MTTSAETRIYEAATGHAARSQTLSNQPGYSSIGENIQFSFDKEAFSSLSWLYWIRFYSHKNEYLRKGQPCNEF